MPIKNILYTLFLFIVLGAGSTLNMACSQAQLSSSLTVAENAAWTAANAYETVNTATGGALTTTLLDSALVATHNTGDINVVNAAGALADKVLAAQAAAKAIGMSPAGLQAVATATLSDPSVISAAAATLPAAAQVPQNSIPVAPVG